MCLGKVLSTILDVSFIGTSYFSFFLSNNSLINQVALRGKNHPIHMFRAISIHFCKPRSKISLERAIIGTNEQDHCMIVCL